MGTDKKAVVKKEKELLSLREYAKWCETSHQTVKAAIDAGKIIEGYDRQTKKINKVVADLEWGIEFTQKQAMKRVPVDLPDDGSPLFDNDNLLAVSPEIPISTPYQDVVRLKLLYEARKARLAAEEAAGRLVDKDVMYKQMFDFGAEIKSAFQNIPDRIIDRLITMERNEAHLLLKSEIDKVLEKLSEPE